MSMPDVKRFSHGSRVPGWGGPARLSKDPQEVPDPATTPVPVDLREEIEHHIAKYPDRRSAAIPSLAAAQQLHGWCSPEAFRQVACVMRLAPAYLVAVASFYDMLDTQPLGHQRVYVCTNISCSLRGGRKLLGELSDAVGDDPGVRSAASSASAPATSRRWCRSTACSSARWKSTRSTSWRARSATAT